MNKAYRIEKDSMGKVKVPQETLYGAQTQRAVENFPVSGICTVSYTHLTLPTILLV